MKKQLFLAATAIIALASCSSDEFVGDNSPDKVNTNETAAITFGSSSKGLTRADHVGADAASMLNKKFYVVGFHGNVTTMDQVFDNYLVEWTANTAGVTQSNTSDWEYVGKTAPIWSGITGKTQTIKYWDYSSSQYDFIAWSPGTAGVITGETELSDGNVKITKPAKNSPYAPTYSLQGSRADLAKCYIADLVTAYKADQTPAQPKFQDEVKFTFRNLACKVRMAIYETVPGYSVKDVKFYVDDATTAISTGATLTNAYLFTSGTTASDKFYTAGTYTVSFPTIGASNISETDYNKAHVSFAATGSGTNEDFGELKLVGAEAHEAAATAYLGRTLPTASYAGTASPDNYYKIMLPNETGTVLELRVDYTLLATDGSGEEIKIHGAKAFVPAIYAEWRPNYAYTYVFKISDGTNGWTSTTTTDPAGLYPITFDAIVVDSEEHTQSTITTVSSPSITTYQKGHDVTTDEYKKPSSPDATDDTNDAIYAQVMNDGTLVDDLNGSNKSFFYSVQGASIHLSAEPEDWPARYYTDAACTSQASGTFAEGDFYRLSTEADVMDALNIRTSGTKATVEGRNGITLTPATADYTVKSIPGEDGNWITKYNGTDIAAGMVAKLSPSAAGTYAYVYATGTDNADTDIYSAQNFAKDASQPAGWDSSDATKMEWYEDPDGTIKCTGAWNSSAFDEVKGKTYYRHYTNLNKVYAVKVIKVVD